MFAHRYAKTPRFRNSGRFWGVWGGSKMVNFFAIKLYPERDLRNRLAPVCQKVPFDASGVGSLRNPPRWWVALPRKIYSFRSQKIGVSIGVSVPKLCPSGCVTAGRFCRASAVVKRLFAVPEVCVTDSRLRRNPVICRNVGATTRIKQNAINNNHDDFYNGVCIFFHFLPAKSPQIAMMLCTR